MCDYSLESVQSRPAKVGDRLIGVRVQSIEPDLVELPKLVQELGLGADEILERAIKVLEVAACRGFAALRDAITTKDQIGSALSDRIPAVSQKTYIRPRPSSIRPGLYRRRSEFA
jgi:hypothetical protein